MKTEGIKYAGSKLKLLPHILSTTNELEGIKYVLDGFSGTTRVSQAFAQLGYNTLANDTSEWSKVFGYCYLISEKDDAYYQDLIDHLNALKGFNGWFTENYGGNGKENVKKPFQIKNTQKLDAIRQEIDALGLNYTDKCVLLTSLILALDKVDNTLGHYAAYLSQWSKRSYSNLHLSLPKRFALTSKNKVVQADIFETIKGRTFDLAYFDPPYGSNNEKMPPSRVRYASYYHIWKTVILNDTPQLFGKAARREDSRDTHAYSVFEEFRKDEDKSFIAMQALNQLIQKTDAHYLLLSYSSGGRATKSELLAALSENGKLLKAIEIDYRKNIMSEMSWTNIWKATNNQHKEYLFLLEK